MSLGFLIDLPDVRAHLADGGDPMPSSPERLCRRHRARGRQVGHAHPSAKLGLKVE